MGGGATCGVKVVGLIPFGGGAAKVGNFVIDAGGVILRENGGVALGVAARNLDEALDVLGSTSKNLDTAADTAKCVAKTSATIGNVPARAIDTLDHVRKTGRAPSGHKGGRSFRNDGRGGGHVLSRTDANGNPITYREFDVNPYQRGVNRGSERIVIGSDGRAYFTSDHYRTFTEILQ